MSLQPTKYKAIVTMSISKQQMDRLQALCEVIHTGWGKSGRRLSEEELSGIIGDINILLVGYEKVSATVIEKAHKLQFIACSRSNPVNVDVAAATQRGIPVVHAPGRNANAAAEFTLGLMLSLARNIVRGHQALQAGRYLGEPIDQFSSADPTSDITWNLDGDSPYKQLRGFELRNRTLGLIGLGAVAIRVAELAQAFGMEVVTYTPESDAGIASRLGVQRIGLEGLLRQSDFISIHCKVTEETQGLLDWRAFQMIKPTAYLINTARAVVIEQDALIEALQSRRLAGAALDVFWYEPLPANHPFLKMENVILTPHLGGATAEVPEVHSKMIVDDVFSWIEGKPPAHILNPSVLNPKIDFP